MLPLQFLPGQSADSLGLTGQETFEIHGLEGLGHSVVPEAVQVQADDKSFMVKVRLDTPRDIDYYRHGGIMNYVLRSMLDELPAPPDA